MAVRINPKPDDRADRMVSNPSDYFKDAREQLRAEVVEAQVYRPVRTWRGDIQGELDDYLIGIVTGVVMGGPSVQPVRNFPGTVSTEGQIGIPFAQESGLVVQQHDRLLIDSTLYAVVSERLWTQANALIGTEPTHYWVAVASTS